jgi:hypothetical protein
MSADEAEMATNPQPEEAEMAGTIPTPFNGPNGKPVKVTAEERDELARLGVVFGDADEATDTKKEEGA